MKRPLQISLLVLVCATGLAQAEVRNPFQGRVSFTGMIASGLCATPRQTWQAHIGRLNGISPAGQAAAPGRDDCAGITQTSSVSLTAVSSRRGEAGIITVTYN